MKNKRSIIFFIIGVTVILLMLIGATYAYFQAQIKDGASSEVAIDTDTVDVLTFNASNDISFDVTQDNFKEGTGNKSGTTILNAHLIANNTNQTASYKYNVYLDITKNNFVYSKDTSTPEIVLVIKNPSGQYVSGYNSSLAKWSSNVDLNGESVPGYDITTKIGLIEISLDYLIEATPGTQGIMDQNWQISVVLVNLDSNQVANAGKSFKAKAKVQSEKINVLDLGDGNDYYKSGTYCNKIKNVYFVNYIASKEELNSVGSNTNWDLSSLKDKNIMGWLKEENEDETAPYNLYIGSNLKEGEKIIVRSFAHAFDNMTNLETVNLNLDILDTSNLNDTSFMFYQNYKLTTITGIENLDVSNVTNMSNMFSSTRSLTKLDLSNWDTNNVTNMSRMFSNYKGIEISGIDSFNVSNVINMSNMFDGASKLTTLDLSNWDTHSVIDMSYMFNEANNITELDLNGWNTSQVANMSYMFSGTNGSSTSHFSKIKGIENFDTSNVTTIRGMFKTNDGLTELDLSKWDTTNVTDMSEIFWASHTITSLNLSGWDTSKVKYMFSMFAATYNLTNIDMRKATFSQVTRYDNMFYSTNSDLEIIVTGEENKKWLMEKPKLAESKIILLSE